MTELQKIYEQLDVIHNNSFGIVFDVDDEKEFRERIDKLKAFMLTRFSHVKTNYRNTKRSI